MLHDSRRQAKGDGYGIEGRRRLKRKDNHAITSATGALCTLLLTAFSDCLRM